MASPAPAPFTAAATMMAVPPQMASPAPLPDLGPPHPPPQVAVPVPVMPAPALPAQIPVSAKTLIFAPIAPQAQAQAPAPSPPAAPPPAVAQPVAQEPRRRRDTPAAPYASSPKPEIGEPPTAQAGQMNVRPLRPTPAVGLPVKVVARGAEPTDLSRLTPPVGGGRRPTSDIIGAPRPADPQEKRDARTKPAHAEGVKVVLPDAPVMEVGRDAVAPVSDRGTGEIKALRVRLTQELAVVKLPEPNRKKVVILAGLGGMVAALIVWWLVS